MIDRLSRPALTRRLMAHCLMLGLASVASFALGIICFGVANGTGVDEPLRDRLRQTARLIAADYAERGGEQVPALLKQLRAEQALAYAAVISEDGEFLAHTTAGRIGQTTDPPSNWLKEAAGRMLADQAAFQAAGRMPAGEAAFQAAGIEQVRRLTGAPGTVCRFRAPLEVDAHGLRILEAATLDHDAESWTSFLSRLSPTAFLAPLLILAFGSAYLARTTLSASRIERQLVDVSADTSADPVQLEMIEEIEPSAAGWNRLVERSMGGAPAGNMEQRVREALGDLRQRQAEQILNSLGDGIAVTDSDGRITFANSAFGALFHLNAGEFEGQLIEDVLPLEHSPDRDSIRERIAEAYRPFVVEMKCSEQIEGGILRLSRCPLAGSESQPTSHVWSIRDITQQKLSEEMRNQFVYSATHELRTPLANIKAYAETLALNELTDVERQKEFCNTINSEATRLARFVDELLNISRMEAGSLSLDRQEIDFSRLLSDVISKVNPQMEQQQLEFQTRVPAKLPKLHVDKDKITAALVNLFGNAVKYTPQGGRVTLQVEVEDRELRIAVEDTGIGISKTELPKIFNKFFRSEDARVREVSGTGLGLSFAQEVVRLHGGKFTVHSEQDKGSKFTMHLPLY